MITKRRPDRKRILLSVAIAVLVSGCAAATGPDDTGGGETSKARREGPKPPTTMVYPTTMIFPEPPGSTLSYRGETVDGCLGTYCWTSGGGGGCADAFAIILGEEELEALAGATLSFAYRGKALDSLSVAAYKAGREGGGGSREDDTFLPPSGVVEGKISRSAAPRPGRASSPNCPPASTCSKPSPGCPRAMPPTVSG